MKYFVINIQNDFEGATIQSINAYADLKEALSVYHSTLASNYVSTTLASFAVSLMDEHCVLEKSENYYPNESE